jgi:hypothetical protein
MLRLSKGLVILALAGSYVSAAASPKNPVCSETLREAVKARLDDATKPLHDELAQTRAEIESGILQDAQACGGLTQVACTRATVAKALDPETSTSRLKKFFDGAREMSCILSKQRSARDTFLANSNMALNLTATIATMTLFHQHSKKQAEQDGTPAPKFNSALAASMVIFTVYRSIVQCKNELAGAGDVAANSFGAKFRRYTELNLIGNGIYVGMLAGEDVWAGKNPFEKDNLERYFHEFALSMVWDTGMGVLGIKVMDGFFLKSLPRLRETLAQKIREGVIRPVFARVHGRPTILLKVENLSQIPGFAFEIFMRTAWSAERTVGFMGTRDAYMDWAIE